MRLVMASSISTGHYMLGGWLIMLVISIDRKSMICWQLGLAERSRACSRTLDVAVTYTLTTWTRLTMAIQAPGDVFRRTEAVDTKRREALPIACLQPMENHQAERLFQADPKGQMRKSAWLCEATCQPETCSWRRTCSLAMSLTLYNHGIL